MSSDFKIDFFAYNFFNDFWVDIGAKEYQANIVQIYGDECIKDNSFLEACDDSFGKVYFLRYLLFSPLYQEEIDVVKIKSWKCLSDFYDFVSSVCNRDDLFGHLNIFDKMFATSTFVLELCITIFKDNILDVVNYGHIIWAMYFDQFSEQFYKEGGWNELIRVAKTYESLFTFMALFLDNDLRSFKEASVNYCWFQMTMTQKYNYNKESKVPISKIWIKIRLENFQDYVVIPPLFVNLCDGFEIELLLQHLKLVCSCPSKKDGIFEDKFLGMFCSTTTPYPNSMDKCEAINTIDTNITSETVCDERSKKGCEAGFQGACSEPSGKTTNGFIELGTLKNKCEAVLNQYSSIKSDNIKKILHPVIKYINEYSNQSTNLDLNKFTSFENGNEDPYSIIVKERLVEMNSPNILPTCRNQNNDEGIRIPLKSLPNAIDLYSNNQVIGSDNSKCPLDLSFSNQNQDIYIGDTVSYTNQTIENYHESNIGLENMCTPIDYPAGIEVTCNIDEKNTINKKRDKLREEQNDSEIKNFLKLVLVLGDQQGNQYVCRTLCNSEDRNQNSQIKSKKGKKKSKKKSRK